MKTIRTKFETALSKLLLGISILTIFVLSATPISAQHAENYKHPYLNASGHILDSTGIKLGWISEEGVVHNIKGEKVAIIKGSELLDTEGKKLGRIGKNGTYYDNDGAIVFTVDANSKGEKCKIFDPEGKVIATVHESYKNQACAIHCVSKKMPKH